MSDNAASTPPAVESLVARLGIPVLVVVGLIGVAAAQGGYFPTSWGWSSMTSLWVLAIWLVASAKTDASSADAAFLGCLVLLVAWIGLSVAWSSNPAITVLEFERALVLVGGCAAFLALVRRSTVPQLTLTVLIAIVSVSGYALATRLFPLRFGLYEAAGVYRLSEPIGYWNGLGIFAVLGILLALGFVASGEASITARTISAVALVLLPVTLYFTFSRGSWISLGFGYAVAVGASARRLRLLTSTAVIAPGAAIAVVLASRSRALTHEHATLAAAVRDGRHLALALVLLMALAVVCAFLLAGLAARLAVGTRPRRVVGVSIVVICLLALTGGLVRAGGPIDAARRGYRAFVGPPPSDRADLNARLLDLSGNGRGALWSYAWRTYRSHPVLGTGAGTFERAWQKNPKATQAVRDAHGLYIETLAELGPLGLLLLAGMFALPVVAGLRTRRHSLVPATLGAYCAFLLHASADWDWELVGVTLTALVMGCLLLAEARRGGERTLRAFPRYGGAGVAVALGAASAVGLLGNIPLSRATHDTAGGRYQRAVSEAVQARRWQPWSPQPWIALGEAQLGLGLGVDAASSFRKALTIDGGEWRSWLDLALATGGQARTLALAHAERLYPRSQEIANAVAELGRAKPR